MDEGGQTYHAGHQCGGFILANSDFGASGLLEIGNL
jgi:hypothetical protein